MIIKKIEIQNFKSYKNLELTFNNLNYIIGGNAAGKSNFVSVLKFFSDIVEYGIDDAILLQGGMKYLYNFNSKKDSKLKFNIVIEFESINEKVEHYYPINKGVNLPHELNYTLNIKPNEKGDGYKIISEKMKIEFYHYSKIEKKLNKDDSFMVKIQKDKNGYLDESFNKNKYNDDEDEIISLSFFNRYLKNSDTLIKGFLYAYNIINICQQKIKIYNFDVNLMKSPSSIIARNELEENGANLVNIIQRLLKSKSNKEKLNKLMGLILPFVDDINVENNVNKSLFFKLKETYSNKEFPSYLLSDGTVNILALIVALYFQDDNDIIVLEEPERNIHPKLLSHVVSLLEDVSSKKQIFITTHNPYILKEGNLSDIILISRNSNGDSIATKPSNDEKIVNFLKNDLGIDDLFVSGVLK